MSILDQKEILDKFDDALAESIQRYDYYPDQLALIAYADALHIRTPLEGDAYEAFKHTNWYRNQYRELSSKERCSLILRHWNEENPDKYVEDPFA